MKNPTHKIFLVGSALGLAVACSSLPTRATIEKDEDKFCQDVAAARAAEAVTGTLPKDAGSE